MTDFDTAMEVAREHVRWAIVSGQSLHQIVLSIGGTLPRADINGRDVEKLVAQTWLTLRRRGKAA